MAVRSEPSRARPRRRLRDRTRKGARRRTVAPESWPPARSNGEPELIGNGPARH